MIKRTQSAAALPAFFCNAYASGGYSAKASAMRTSSALLKNRSRPSSRFLAMPLHGLPRAALRHGRVLVRQRHQRQRKHFRGQRVDTVCAHRPACFGDPVVHFLNVTTMNVGDLRGRAERLGDHLKLALLIVESHFGLRFLRETVRSASAGKRRPSRTSSSATSAIWAEGAEKRHTIGRFPLWSVSAADPKAVGFGVRIYASQWVTAPFLGATSLRT